MSNIEYPANFTLLNKLYSAGKKSCDWCNRVHKFYNKIRPAVTGKCRKYGVTSHYSKSKKCTGKRQNRHTQSHLVNQGESEQTDSETCTFSLVVWLTIEIVLTRDGMCELILLQLRWPGSWIREPRPESLVPKSVFDKVRKNFEKLGPLCNSDWKLVGAGN